MVEFLNKICKAECNFEEIKIFCQNKTIELDLENSFEKYYDIKMIENAIKKCIAKEIDYEYLSFWATAYNKIIMASVNQQKNLTFKTYIQYEISDILDSLSLINTFEDVNLKDYIEDIKFYNKIYENLDIFKIYYNISKDKKNKMNTYFLITNDYGKEFAALTWEDMEYKTTKEYEQEVSYLEMMDLITKLSDEEYIEM